ncbi:MAG: beta-galactosidase, partial [Verrucomicrobia bacterium]|nr:beta-galactosidase [Verrucomicrobiota bacterium]
MSEKRPKIPPIYFTVLRFFLLLCPFLVFQVGCDRSITAATETAEDRGNVDPIRLGTHYEYPFGGMATRPEWMPRGEEDWRRDIAMIAETGLNSIRIRIGMDSDLNEVGTLLDIAHENGLTVLFGTATFYVNDEFVERYPDSKIIGGDGSVLPIDTNDVRWQRACIDHPFYRQDRNRILEECVSRFKDHPSVIAWDVHNEPWIAPFPNACFCDYTLAKYRAALKQEFNEVQTFNKTFGTEFEDFDTVRPPAERTEADEEFYIHWREFIASDVNDFLLEGREIFRKHVPDALITHNVTHFVSLQTRGQDWWLFKDQNYNLLTMSRYLGTNEKTVGTSMGFEVLKAMNPGIPAWVTEFQGGPFPTPGPNILYSGKEIEIELNNLLGHGMKGLYFYRWDPLLNGAEPMVNGMIEPDSYDTDRRLGLQRAIKALEPHLPFIARAESLTPSVAIYFTRDQVMRDRPDDAGDFVGGGSLRGGGTILKATRGAYQLLSDIGYEAACIVHGTKDLGKYKAVVFPHVSDLTESEIDDIEAYVANGGSAIIDLPPQDPAAVARFTETFGIQASQSEKLRYLLYSG